MRIVERSTSVLSDAKAPNGASRIRTAVTSMIGMPRKTAFPPLPSSFSVISRGSNQRPVHRSRSDCASAIRFVRKASVYCAELLPGTPSARRSATEQILTSRSVSPRRISNQSEALRLLGTGLTLRLRGLSLRFRRGTTHGDEAFFSFEFFALGVGIQHRRRLRFGFRRFEGLVEAGFPLEVIRGQRADASCFRFLRSTRRRLPSFLRLGFVDAFGLLTRTDLEQQRALLVVVRG